MPRQTKAAVKVTEKNTKNEILEAYHELMEQAVDGSVEDDVVKQEQKVLDSAAKETVEKVTTDLSRLRITANQTISSLTEQLTAEAERFGTLQKAISVAQKELEEISQIKLRAGMLKRMIELQKQEEEKFEKEMAEKRAAWAHEQKVYEEGLKKERSREEEEYVYQKSLRMKREKDMFEEEKRAWERDMQEKKRLHAEQETELADLRKQVVQFPVELDKAVKTAIAESVALERKESQVRQNFAKQEWDSKQQLSALKITSLEQMVKAQTSEIEELKRQLEKATQQVKDIAVTVIEGVKKASDTPVRTPAQNTV
jgi:hypothetical protein